MINPNIASKVFQIFSQMAKSNFSIAVDEDNVKDLSTTEWRIIQEVGYGESNKEIAAKTLLVRRNRAQLLINDFGEIKPTRSNAISDLVSPNRSDET